VVRLCLLGDVRVQLDGAQVELASVSRKARLLLAMLALERRVHGRSELAGRLWPDVREDSARVSLRTALSQLRSALGPAASLVLRGERDGGVALAADVGTDVEEVERLLAGGEPEAALDRCSAQLLSGVDDDWVLERRDELRDRVAQGLGVAAARAEEAGDLQRAVDLTRRMAALDPLGETPHRELIRRLAAVEDHGAAHAVYDRFRARLAEELRIAPSAATRSLVEKLRTEETATLATCRVPCPPNRTIGRGRDIDAACTRARDPGVRLLTLTGPGGVGKTRLALEIARRMEADFADGACFVSLAEIAAPQEIPSAVVQALGILSLAGEAPRAAIERFASAKQLLLVLDNLEHVVDGASFIGGLLAACPAVTVLATSREPLGLQAEERFQVTPLALPPPAQSEDPDALARVDAVALFCERARAHDRVFELDVDAGAVAEVCRRLDGLPLAIELAAARCGLLSAGEIAERLHEAVAAPGAGARDAPARQQTLRATIDWSYQLLSDADKAVFARFSAFTGGATIAAAETVTGADLAILDRLVAKSLLVRRDARAGTARLGMLETIRAYAADRLWGAPDNDAVHERHFRCYLALAQRHGGERAVWGSSAREHLARLDADVDNLHGALRWAIQQQQAEHALNMVVALGCYWLTRVRNMDAVELIEQALSLSGIEALPALRVRAICTKTRALWPIGRGAEQASAIAEAEAVARALGDPAVIAEALQLRVDYETGAPFDPGRLDAADALADEALHWARVAGDEWEIAQAARAKARATFDIAELRRRVQRAARLLEQVGNVYQLGHLLEHAAYQALCMGSDRDAMQLVERALPIARSLGTPFIGMFLLGHLGVAAQSTGDTDAAYDAFREQLELCRELVVLPLVSRPLRGLAAVAVARGEPHRAARLVGAAASYSYDRPKGPVDARLDTAFFDPARRRCGADAWDAAARDGRELSFQEAVAYALEEPAVGRAEVAYR
jgi:predicted ATPase/DNA-binding SARP family transcriptional activator